MCHVRIRVGSFLMLNPADHMNNNDPPGTPQTFGQAVAFYYLTCLVSQEFYVSYSTMCHGKG